MKSYRVAIRGGQVRALARGVLLRSCLGGPLGLTPGIVMADKPIILSGMQPTGGLHIGNYLGALKQWATLVREDQHDALFCIVDAHAITIPYEPEKMPGLVLDAATSYIAAGIDPDQCTIFLQSDVPEHMELAWYLSAVTALGDLHRMTQFKEKSDQHKENVNAGLFTYPVLQAADILIYKANLVPVGDDQKQHLELAREIARRFNTRFTNVFPEPQAKLSRTPRIMGLDGKSKMSKSKGNTIGLLDAPKTIEKRLKSAFTDEKKLRLGDPGRPEVCNVFTMHTALSPTDQIDTIRADCQSGALGCGDCKKALSTVMLAELEPIRARADELNGNPKRVLEVLKDGGARARKRAQATMADVHTAMGLTTDHRGYSSRS